jgi:antitoxin ParD1/3/4
MVAHVHTEVETGFYSNASDVIRDAIHRMREEVEKIFALRVAVPAGDGQLARGERTACTPELLDNIATTP